MTQSRPASMNGEHKHGGFKDSEQTVEDVSELLDPAAEKRLVRKVDIRLIPILFALYLCAFLDRYVIHQIIKCGRILICTGSTLGTQEFKAWRQIWT